MPASAASRLARGETRRRGAPSSAAPSEEGGGATDEGATGEGKVVTEAAWVSGAAAGAEATGAGAAGAGGGGASGIASPASPTHAHTELTGTVSPSWTTRARRTPSSKDSTSMALLSVSISNRMSPLWTGSPTCLCQVVRTHSSVIWPGFGIRIGMSHRSVPSGSQAVRGGT